VSTNMSIQESLYPELTCFGCGNANPHGLHLRSHRGRRPHRGRVQAPSRARQRARLPQRQHPRDRPRLSRRSFRHVGGRQTGLEGPHGHARAVRHGVIRREVPPPHPPQFHRMAHHIACKHRRVPDHRQIRDGRRRQGDCNHDGDLGSLPPSLSWLLAKRPDGIARISWPGLPQPDRHHPELRSAGRAQQLPARRIPEPETSPRIRRTLHFPGLTPRSRPLG
jgi:hypothetical protein